MRIIAPRIWGASTPFAAAGCVRETDQIECVIPAARIAWLRQPLPSCAIVRPSRLGEAVERRPAVANVRGDRAKLPLRVVVVGGVRNLAAAQAHVAARSDSRSEDRSQQRLGDVGQARSLLEPADDDLVIRVHD